jgi:WD40 repeat protein
MTSPGGATRCGSGCWRTSDNVVVTPDSRFVICGSTDGRIKVCDAKTLAAIRTIQALRSVHRIHLLHSDPAQLVGGDHVGGVTVWNIQTGAMIASYVGHVGHVYDVTATIDGRLLISAGEDDFLLFWPGPSRGPDDKLKRFLRQAADRD